MLKTKKTGHTAHLLKSALVSVLLSLVAIDASAETGPIVQLKPGNWVVMGSSTAFGSGAPRGKGWVALLEAAYAKHGVQVINIASRGTVTYRGLSTSSLRVTRRPPPERKRNVDAALALQPALLIVSYPTNDTASGYSVDETVDNLLAIRAQAQVAGVAVIVTSTQPRNLDDTKLPRLRAVDDRLAASVGPCFVEMREALANADGKLAPQYDAGDGVHPNSAGHAVIAEHVIGLIESKRCVRLPQD